MDSAATFADDAPMAAERRWVGVASATGLIVLALGTTLAIELALPDDLAFIDATATLAGHCGTVTLVAALVTALAWTRARPVFWGAVVIGVGAQLFLLGSYALGAPRVEARLAGLVLSDADLAPPRLTEGGTRLRSDSLGFELDAPTGLTLVEDREVLDAMRSRAPTETLARSIVAWRWQNEAPDQVLIVSVISLGELDEDHAFERFQQQLDAGRDTMTAQGIQIADDHRPTRLEQTLRAVEPSHGASVYAHTIGYMNGSRFVVVSAIGNTGGTGAGALDAVIDSLHALD